LLRYWKLQPLASGNLHANDILSTWPKNNSTLIEIKFLIWIKVQIDLARLKENASYQV